MDIEEVRRGDWGGGAWRERLFRFASCCALGMLAAIRLVSSNAEGSGLGAVAGLSLSVLKRRLSDSMLELLGAGGNG